MVVAKAVAFLLCALCTLAVAADPRERGFITRGMHEAEVLAKIGQPDKEEFINNAKGQPEEKTWTYLPHARDPQTRTTLTLRAAIVEQVERRIVR